MRKLLILALTLLPAVSFGIKGGKLSGKWKEVKRWKPDNTVIDYKDTIRIEFLIGNEYTWQKPGGYIYRGTYKLGDKDLDLGMRDFTIVERRPDKLVLKDDQGQYEFAPDHTPAATQNTLPAEQKPRPVTSIDQMVGHWSVYKRTSDKTLQQVDYSRQLKMIDITGGSSDGKLGYLYSTHDADDAPSWYVESYSNQTLYCNGKDQRQFKVLKCQDNDLIIEESGITYFFRQFK